jgi:hypothetical protein
MGRHGGPEERAWRLARVLAVASIPPCALAVLAVLPMLGVAALLAAPAVPLGVMVGSESALRRVLAPRPVPVEAGSS